MVDDEEAHHGDADLTQQEQAGDDPADPHIAQLAVAGGHHKGAEGEQFVGDRIHQLAQFGHLVVFARKPTVEFVGGRGDEEDDCGRPAHAHIAQPPRASRNVQSQKHHNKDDAAEGDEVRR